MTLLELSLAYAESAAALRQRILLLESSAQAVPEEEAQRLLRRAAALRPLWREAKELAKWTAHYYDRSYYGYEKYKL